MDVTALVLCRRRGQSIMFPVVFEAQVAPSKLSSGNQVVLTDELTPFELNLSFILNLVKQIEFSMG